MLITWNSIHVNRTAKDYSERGPSGAAIYAAGRARFGDDYFGEQGKFGFEQFPNPNGDVLARRIFQAGDFVEIKVVEFFPEWFERNFHFSVVHDPSQLCVARAFDCDFDFETVTVKTAALMRLRQVWQQVGCFELECFS
jgi:hypothetical protein